ncbi:MAG: gamma-glutamylcyclotransferase family protein [Planctomycetota bacterium]|jgi:hypothetical protein
MAKPKTFNLFVYGTLMNPSVFRAVTGRRLVRRPTDADGVSSFLTCNAVLHGYKKVSFDNTYQYAVPDRNGRIRGYVIPSLPGELMTALREYEGRNYRKRTVRVWVSWPRDSINRGQPAPREDAILKGNSTKAVAFVGNLKELQHSFGYAFRDPLKQEVLLGQKIDKALLEAEREQLHTTESAARRAVGELRGATIRDLVRRHFEAGGISDYAIRHSLKDAPLPDFERIRNEPEANALSPNYLAMVVRQVIFNQTEERVRSDFRYELDHMGMGTEHYERTISSLATLRMLNDNRAFLQKLVGDCLGEVSFNRNNLVDFVRWAVGAADRIYDARRAKREINFIESHSSHGYISLGAELEFSNIGHSVISDPQGRALGDRSYDGFIYFSDFGLDVLTWKIGGHIDDHHERTSTKPRRGFFEVAMGILSIEEDISKPVTDDPWLLNELIHQIRRFYDIAPHSVHISLQLRTRHKPALHKLLPLPVMKCLFAIAGDPARDIHGRLRINRLTSDEIITLEPIPHMLFSEITVRRSGGEEKWDQFGRRPDATWRYVQQFRFLRLSPRLNYEPIVLGLKGLQIHLRPGTFLAADQYEANAKHKRLFDELIAWGAEPEPIPDREIETFLRSVYKGLMTERRGRPAHSEAYIVWGINQLKSMLYEFNKHAARQH